MDREKFCKHAAGWNALYRIMDREDLRDKVDDLEEAFIMGAKWADANPITHWYNTKDKLPIDVPEIRPDSCHTGKVLVENDKGEYFTAFMVWRNGKGIWKYETPYSEKSQNIKRWTFIPEYDNFQNLSCKKCPCHDLKRRYKRR